MMVPGLKWVRERAAWARVASASGQVSAEVVIASERESAGLKTGAGGKTDTDFRETGGEGPGFAEAGGLVFGNGEKEFVILTAGGGLAGGGAWCERKFFWIEAKSDPGHPGESGEVGPQPIA
jgi:hypothetical protein